MPQGRPLIRLGTRKSPLAQAQADRVLSLLPAGAAEKVLVESQGDLDPTSPLHRMERPGAFTSVLTEAILRGEIDAAVHSLKDLPLQAPEEAPLVAILPRDDAADVLLVREVARDASRPLGLAAGSRVGSSAPRRQSQVLAADSELIPLDVRGNVGTRLRLLEAGVLDGLLMAAAAFERMTLPLPLGVASVRLDPARHPVGPGQGTIAVQARAGSDAARLVARLDHAPTRAAVELERALLGALGGGCGMPLGAYAERDGRAWRLHATLAPDDWARHSRPRLARASATSDTPEEALALVLEGLRAPAHEPAAPAARRLVLLTLPESALDAYRAPLAESGWRAEAWPLIEDAPTGAPLPPGAEGAAWLAVASPRAAAHAARYLAQRAGPPPRVAALGPATARALRAEGWPVHVCAPEGTGASLAEAIAVFPAPPGAVLVPQATRPLPELRKGLEARGFAVLPWPVYDTRPRLPAPVPSGGAEAIVLTSPSNAEAFAAANHPWGQAKLVAFGPSTETAMRKAGLPVHGVATRRSATGILEALP